MSNSSPQIPFNFIPTQPSLTDALNLLKKDVMLSLNVHHIGTIQSFDAETQTAKVTINYPKTYFQLDVSTGLYQPVQVNYPILVDCPVICLGGGSAALTFPISKDDECLVLFNDRDLDNWFQGGAGAAVATPRLHSFSDGIVLVGLRSLNNVLGSYDAIRAVLRNGIDGTTMVGVGPTLVKIANNSTTLNTLLQTLISNIETLVTATAAITVSGVTTGGGVSGVPVNAAAITAVGASLSATAAQIAGLLE